MLKARLRDGDQQALKMIFAAVLADFKSRFSCLQNGIFCYKQQNPRILESYSRILESYQPETKPQDRTGKINNKTSNNAHAGEHGFKTVF